MKLQCLMTGVFAVALGVVGAENVLAQTVAYLGYDMPTGTFEEKWLCSVLSSVPARLRHPR